MGVIETTVFRKNRKQNLVKISGGKCNLCGYDKTFSALEFHHINPDEKTMEFLDQVPVIV